MSTTESAVLSDKVSPGTAIVDYYLPLKIPVGEERSGKVVYVSRNEDMDIAYVAEDGADRPSGVFPKHLKEPRIFDLLSDGVKVRYWVNKINMVVILSIVEDK